MSTKTACLACRAKKIKCALGSADRCERCTTLGFEDCTYEAPKQRKMGRTLGTGEACERCRLKKRKCDAKRPCTRCVEANAVSECEYKAVDNQPGLDEPKFILWNEDSSIPAPWDVSTGDPRTVGDTAPESSANSQTAIIETVPPVLTVGIPSGGNGPLSHGSQGPQERAPGGAGGRRPPLSTRPSPTPPRVSPEPHVTLLVSGAERLQLSEVALGELDKKLINVISRLSKLGIRFTSEKQQALLRGDISGTIIHPFFIHSAQAMGMHFCEGMGDSSAMIRLQAKHLQMALEWLVEIFEGQDWEVRAQVALWVTTTSIALSSKSFPLRYIQKACEAINAAGLRFIPTHGQPPQFSEGLHEKLSVLSQIIYFENYLFLVCGGAEPTMTAMIEEEFQYQLPRIYPVLFKICPLTMRTKTILLVRDAVLMLARHPIDEAQVYIWKQSCDQIFAALYDYSKDLLYNLQRFQGLGDKGGAEMIRGSCINCFAHLAVLCEALCRFEPTPQKIVDTLCDCLGRLGELTEGAGMEEYTQHDLLLGVSWEKVLGISDAGLVKIPPEQGTQSRNWMKVVENAHLDFAARFPEAKIPTLALRAREEDGRIEGSRYPNLILSQERQQYGI